MTRHEEKLARRFHLAALLALRTVGHETAWDAALDAAKITLQAKALQSLAVMECNTGLSPGQEARRKRLIVCVEELANRYALKADCHGDPRGAVVKLTGRHLPSNELGGAFAIHVD